MNDAQKIELANIKIDCLIELTNATLAFIRAPHTKNPNKHWDKANKEYQSIIKKYRKKTNEYYGSITSIENEVS